MHHVKNKRMDSLGPVADHETARLVELCVDQIKAAVDEAFIEIDALSRAFLDTARHASALLGPVSDQHPDLSPAEDSLQVDSRALREAVHNASMRLQFADRLHQRLSNVSKNLAGLAELMRSSGLPTTDIKWAGFLKQTRATFTMEQERQLFDARYASSVAEDGAELATDVSRGPTACDGEASNER